VTLERQSKNISMFSSLPAKSSKFTWL
jgi:hypothetical protein